jgi:hypothetical protein
MHPELVRGESVVEFFKCLVEGALTHQRLSALELTQHYLVQLLATRTRSDAAPSEQADEPLALRYARALEAGGVRQRYELRGLADHTLFVSGFFSDSLCRSVVDVEYFASLGGHAYQYLGSFEADTLSPAYRELGDRFLAFADVLTEVSELAGLTSDRDLLRLYERWLAFGSPRNRDRLVRHGITPVAAAPARRPH